MGRRIFLIHGHKTCIPHKKIPNSLAPSSAAGLFFAVVLTARRAKADLPNWLWFSPGYAGALAALEGYTFRTPIPEDFAQGHQQECTNKDAQDNVYCPVRHYRSLSVGAIRHNLTENCEVLVSITKK